MCSGEIVLAPLHFLRFLWICRSVGSALLCITQLHDLHLPFLQEVLDSLVNSETLPTKLAEVINQFVAEGWVWFVNPQTTHALMLYL